MRTVALTDHSTTPRSTRFHAVKLLAIVGRLARRNRWQQLARSHVALVVVAVGIAIAMLTWLANSYTTDIADGAAWVLRFPLLIVVIVGWVALIFAARQRRRSRRDAEHSWLAALPLGEQAFAVAARRSVAAVLAITLAMALSLLFALGWLVALPVQSMVTMALLLTTGALLGAVIGWTLARKAPRPKRIRLPNIATHAETRRFELGRWPVSHSRAHADFALHARAIGALLLSLPIGVPALVVIAIIVFGLMALVIFDITRALLTTTNQAGAWLRSLPLNPHQATLALGGRSLLAAIAATFLLVVAILPAGIRGSTAIAIVVAIGSTIAVAFAVMAALQQPFGARR